MPTTKLNKRAIDAIQLPLEKQAMLWDSELRGFGVRVLPSGLKTFIVQYRNIEGIKRRMNIGRYGVITVDQARDLARIKIGLVAAGEDPADKLREMRNGKTVAELCDWYLTEARSGNILGRRNRPIKASTLALDESRIETHIKPLVGKRMARHLTISDVEQMQADVKNGLTAKPRGKGRGGQATGGHATASRCLATLQAVLGHAKHKGLIAEHPTRGAKVLAITKRTRRLSAAEIEALGKAIAFARHDGENGTALAVIETIALTGYRRQEAQAMKRQWISAEGGFVAFPDTKGDAQVRAIGPEAAKVVLGQPVVAGNPHAFPSLKTDGPFTATSAIFKRVCKMAGIEGATLHTLRHTFASVAGDLGFSELTIRAMLGHASQNVTQDYIHIDEALKLAVRRTSDEVAQRLAKGAAQLRPVALAA